MLTVSLFWWFFNFSKPEQPNPIPAESAKIYTKTERQQILLEAGFIPTFRPYPIVPHGSWQFFAKKGAVMENKTLSNFLKDQKKPIILHVWAHWCGPCKKELPEFSKFAYKVSDKVTIISMVSGDADKVWEFYNTNGLVNLNLAVDYNSVIGKAFTIKSIPTTIFINKNGEVIGKIIGAFDWSDQKKTNALIQALTSS